MALSQNPQPLAYEEVVELLAAANPALCWLSTRRTFGFRRPTSSRKDCVPSVEPLSTTMISSGMHVPAKTDARQRSRNALPLYETIRRLTLLLIARQYTGV